MGSKAGGAAASPAPAPAVCCMCGDHGLTQELFRCKVCISRSQHKYCSDLYPKVESYRACNWCLREEGEKALPKEAMKDLNSKSPASNNSETTANGSNVSGVKLHRGAPPSQLIKPIKKLRLLNRSASDVTDRDVTGRMIRTEELTPNLARGRPAFRGKVRRYKLLEEVSS